MNQRAPGGTWAEEERERLYALANARRVGRMGGCRADAGRVGCWGHCSGEFGGDGGVVDWATPPCMDLDGGLPSVGGFVRLEFVRSVRQGVVEEL